VSFNYVYASEAYKANLNDIASTRESMKSTARIKANREREVPSWKGHLISTKQAMDNTQRLYYQIDEIRYKNQLLQESWGTSSSIHKTARASQVHKISFSLYIRLIKVICFINISIHTF
jgi:hypothetical protein